MNLTSKLVDDAYLKVFVVAQAVVAEVLSKLFAVLDGFQVAFEVDPDPVSRRDTIFHIEKELLHAVPQIASLEGVVYGITRDDWVIVLANSISATLALTVLGFKTRDLNS
jgi:hypothetical protein